MGRQMNGLGEGVALAVCCGLCCEYIRMVGDGDCEMSEPRQRVGIKCETVDDNVFHQGRRHMHLQVLLQLHVSHGLLGISADWQMDVAPLPHPNVVMQQLYLKI